MAKPSGAFGVDGNYTDGLMAVDGVTTDEIMQSPYCGLPRSEAIAKIKADKQKWAEMQKEKEITRRVAEVLGKMNKNGTAICSESTESTVPTHVISNVPVNVDTDSMPIKKPSNEVNGAAMTNEEVAIAMKTVNFTNVTITGVSSTGINITTKEGNMKLVIRKES